MGGGLKTLELQALKDVKVNAYQNVFCSGFRVQGLRGLIQVEGLGRLGFEGDLNPTPKPFWHLV